MRRFFIRGICLECDIFVLLMLCLMLISGFMDKYFYAFLSMAIHEASHLAAALAFGDRLHTVKILPFGFNAQLWEGHCDKKRRLLIFLAGPLANIFLAIVIKISGVYTGGLSANAEYLIFINVYLSVFNMLPVLPLDGGKIFRELLKDRYGIYYTAACIKKVSLIIAIAISIMGVVQLYNTFYNFSLLFIGAFLFINIKSGKEEAAQMNIKNIIYRRSKLIKRGIYPARDLVVMKWMYLSEMVKNMDFDKFHIIHVLDDNLKMAGSFTEQEIMDVILSTEKDLTFGEFLKIHP